MKSLLWRIYQTSPQHIYRHFANAKRSRTAKNFINNYIQNHSVRKLHVGCGGNALQSWLNTDLVTDNKTIVSLDVSKAFPIPLETFDYIYSEHLFEHLTFKQQLNFLREAFRILKPGGKIRTATPDFHFLAKLAGDNKSGFDREYLQWNFKTFLKDVPEALARPEDLDVYVINNYFRDWGHQLIHTRSSLKNLLKYCGFEVCAEETVGNSSDPSFAGLEKHGAMITDAYNEYETMIIEAVKPHHTSKQA